MFKIHSLPVEAFNPFFSMPDDELQQHKARIRIADANPCYPCRVSMADAEIGETLLEINYSHQPNPSPYQAAHAIFVRKNAITRSLQIDEVPEVLQSRLISVRGFDQHHMMINAEVVDGKQLSEGITKIFYNPVIEYIHAHYAKPGCFAGLITRVSKAG